MNARTLLTIAGVAVLLPRFAFSQEPAKRREWDQKKAVETVKKITALEAEGRPWDKTSWMTDVDRAVARARRENKPIFVFFFLRKSVGPAAAPC